MRKLNKYLIGDFLLTFAVAMLLITFAFSIGGIYKAIDIMAKGLPVGVVGRFIFQNLPYALAYTIPISALFSTLLLFGRLSSDSEISAMKSGGLSLWQIASPILLIAFLLVLASLYNNCVVYPKTTYENRKLIKTSMGVEDPIKLLEEGRFIREFPGYMIYVGAKNRNKVRDLVVYEVDEDSGEVTATVRAESGVLTADKEKAVLKIDLYDVRIEVPDSKASDEATQARYVNAKRYPIRLDFNELTARKNISKKRKHMTLVELIWRVRNNRTYYAVLDPEDRVHERGRDLIEISQRLCLSIAPFMFVLVAIPLGIKSHRRESSAGMLMSLGIVFVYYLFIIISDTMEDYPQFYPWLIPWVPIVAGQIGGILLIRRAE